MNWNGYYIHQKREFSRCSHWFFTDKKHIATEAMHLCNKGKHRWKCREICLTL